MHELAFPVTPSQERRSRRRHDRKQEPASKMKRCCRFRHVAAIPTRTAYLFFVALVGGCGTVPAQGRPVLPLLPARTVHIDVVEHVAGPFQLGRIVLNLDGSPIFHQEPGWDEGDGRREAYRGEVADGVHFVSVEVFASHPCALLGTDQRLRVRGRYSFGVGQTGVHLVFELYSGSRLLPPERRLQGRFRVLSAAEPPDLPSPPTDATACEGDEPIARTICRIESLLAGAIERKNILRASCINEKLIRVQALARSWEERGNEQRFAPGYRPH